MTTNFKLFGPAHLVILGAVVLLAAILAAAQQQLPPGCKWLRVGLAAVLLLDFAVYCGYQAAHGQLAFPDRLPLELCDVTQCLVILALLTLNRAIFDLAYYTALAATSMALLTPNLLEHFPSFLTVQFFVGHGLDVTATLYLVWSRQARPRPGSAGRAMLALNIYAAIAGTFDWIFKTNYMYLCAKPQNASLLDFLGPWPWYIVASEGVALGLFLLLYLPFRQSALKAAQ
ncbi:MAG: TIGR02206 family membrane protein [Terracidiphilus sp.]